MVIFVNSSFSETAVAADLFIDIYSPWSKLKRFLNDFWSDDLPFNPSWVFVLLSLIYLLLRILLRPDEGFFISHYLFDCWHFSR
jgi:hypothetical protein